MTKVKQSKYGSWMIIGDETVYDAYETKHKAQRAKAKTKRATEPREYTDQRRCRALEDLDKHRGWTSLWDIENESSKKKTHR
ncbi:hypothetical protein [Allobaculum stercoricanis]|uniref:hypothetical protein n=1 Tax=Allobaculum stercoricanis TaxID=174709 RepID=UPI0029422450|nr:hypothetical protein [Allobaculum stercoricanis]